MSVWEKYPNIVKQLDLSVKKRQSEYAITCLDCEAVRTVGYCQAYNIVKDIHSGRCQPCAEKNKPPRQKKEKNSRPKLEDVLKYRNMFDNPATKAEVKEKFRQAKLHKYKELANNWHGGKISERLTAMARDEYKQLRVAVFTRDNYTCQLCNVRGGKLEMDHIKEWSNYPELRYEITNCRTLCKDCHKTTDNYGHKAIKRKISV